MPARFEYTIGPIGQAYHAQVVICILLSDSIRLLELELVRPVHNYPPLKGGSRRRARTLVEAEVDRLEALWHGGADRRQVQLDC